MNRRQILTRLAPGCFAWELRLGAADGEISRTGESIHQEPVFQVSRKRVYDLLLTAPEFDMVVGRSDAAKSMGGRIKPATISPAPGGAFSLFGGYITGRQIELTPNERIVQAWRSASWPAGAYSIATFALIEQGDRLDGLWASQVSEWNLKGLCGHGGPEHCAKEERDTSSADQACTPVAAPVYVVK